MQRDEEWPPRLSSTPDLQSPCEICSTTDDSTTAPIPFITHKVSKWDTLAGVAVKYNVSVADIKRANGLLSDSAMYALETIQVPTKLLPLGEELQVLFAQVASGLGRDPVLDAEANLQPASAACARVARTLHIVNDLPNCQAAGPQAGLPWWCQCGACDEDSYDHACRQNRPKGGDVELIECSPHDELMRRGDTPGSNTRMHERMRRRPVNQDDAQDAAAPGTSSQQESDNEPGSGEDEDNSGLWPTSPPWQGRAAASTGPPHGQLLAAVGETAAYPAPIMLLPPALSKIKRLEAKAMAWWLWGGAHRLTSSSKVTDMWVDVQRCGLPCKVARTVHFAYPQLYYKYCSRALCHCSQDYVLLSGSRSVKASQD
ncbi:lysM domain-containing protein [Haematococcus lacustris]|uniref:LysM domain-containing protein n=1 Tax=Haematococcus lacustris TaxID=44745 RepID=A0A699ZCB4_HAELA|nr:lysM domain-containing protein [Haematococcus lacustris]